MYKYLLKQKAAGLVGNFLSLANSYVTELTERIKAKSSPEENLEALEDSAEYVRFFPAFIWALRDFSLQLELNGQPCTEDEYLENALKLKKGTTDHKYVAEIIAAFPGGNLGRTWPPDCLIP